MLAERRPDSPRLPMPALNHVSNQSFSRRHCQSLFSGSSSQGESTLGKWELESPGASHGHGHRMLEPESRCSWVIPETHTCVGTASCKRLHLPHPELCRKIVQKARRAFSKLGRRLHQDSLSYSNSAQDASVHSNYSPSTAAFELDGAAYELPACRPMAYSGTLCEAPGTSIARHEPQQTSFGGDEYIVSPVTPYHGFFGSGSSSSYMDLPGFRSPVKRLSELDGSPSTCSSFSVSTPTVNASRIPPVIGEEGLAKHVPMSAGISDSPGLSLGITSSQQPASGQEQSPGYPFVDDMDFCTSPTSLLPQHEFPNELIENAPAKDVGQAHCSTHQSTLYEATGHASSPENSTSLAGTCLDPPVLSPSRTDDSTLVRDCHVTISTCPCHGLPMRPDMHLSDLCAMARTSGADSDLFVQGNQKTLARRIQSMFSLLVELASERLERRVRCEPKLRGSLAPALEARPDIRAGLNALHDLHTNQSLPSLHGLVSLVFMAFSALMLTVHENELSQCTTELYLDIASWLDALALPDEKRAFRTMLDVLWLPEAGFRSASFGRREFCPFTIPKHYSAQNFQSTALADDYGLRTGMTARICQCYVDRK
jgi:hypothetical protein